MPSPSPPNAEPKVSVLMITYNHEKFIAQAIESVLMQETTFPFELLIGEDYSTDGTAEIVREYSRKRPDIIRAQIRERNVGSKENSRQLWAAAKGKYLALLEGDDYWMDSRKLQLLADVLDENPGTVLCGHRTLMHDEAGVTPDRVLAEDPPGVYKLEDLLPRCFLHTSSVMFRRVLDRPPAWASGMICGDLPLFVELARHGDVRFLDECMSLYRVHRGGVWSGLEGAERTPKLLALYQAYYENLEPKYRPAIQKGLCKVVFDAGLEQFRAGRPDQTRQTLREYCRLSGLFEYLPKKALLILKGYGFWMFPAWRRAKRLFRRKPESALTGGYPGAARR